MKISAFHLMPHLRPPWEDEAWVNYWWPRGLRDATVPTPVASVTA
jgi:hypothetical protein